MAYTKQNFEDGKAVTAAQLNKMDAQIAANENAAAQAKAKATEALSRYGGEMNGPLILASAPAEPMQAATKQYVDAMAEQLGNGGGNAPAAGNFVSYDAQTLTPEQKETARTNIGAASQEEVDRLSGEIEDLKNSSSAGGLSVDAEGNATIGGSFIVDEEGNAMI